MKICVSVGHSQLKDGTFTSANGIVNEYKYCKGLAPELVKILRKEGNTVDLLECPEREFTTPSQEKTYKIPRINGKKYDLLVELHLNSYDGSAHGSEVLYYSQTGKTYADRIVAKLGTIFTNRGSKERPNLYILNSTDCPALIVETFFCDSVVDTNTVKRVGDPEIAKLIAEGILNKKITDVDTSVHKNCVLYEGSVDLNTANIFSWYLDDCVVQTVEEYQSYSTHNLYIVGGGATNKFKARNLPDRFTAFEGANRFDTLNEALNYAKADRFAESIDNLLDIDNGAETYDEPINIGEDDNNFNPDI
ncbi:MAG: N-acetylmuramoyl-L-alanine amidase [Clostridioides sp.]|jgi:N-acetylmuramoyl-L-alanine amidase|nr:N-acetylmuramoyl-L-alanine amidase [Clostridioides sp.]